MRNVHIVMKLHKYNVKQRSVKLRLLNLIFCTKKRKTVNIYSHVVYTFFGYYVYQYYYLHQIIRYCTFQFLNKNKLNKTRLVCSFNNCH